MVSRAAGAVSNLIWGQPKPGRPQMREIKSRYDYDSAVGVDMGLSVLYFDATYHDTYHWLLPKVAEISQVSKARFYVCVVNELGLEDLAAEVGITTLPTFQIFRSGEPAALVEGPKLKTLDRFLAQLQDPA